MTTYRVGYIRGMMLEGLRMKPFLTKPVAQGISKNPEQYISKLRKQGYPILSIRDGKYTIGWTLKK